jgi:hypothetical protein
MSSEVFGTDVRGSAGPLVVALAHVEGVRQL